jgi:predicted nucleotidyltransferase
MKKTIYTPYPYLDVVLKNHVYKLKEVLEDNLVGVYLQGSLAIGGFDLTSDIDFIVVTQEDLSDKQANIVQQVHLETYNQKNRWVKRIEYSFFPKNKLDKFSSPFKNGRRNDTEDRRLWYFDNGSRNITKSDHCNTLVTRWTLREKGIALIGPDPKKLINHVNSDDLRREIKDTMVGWSKEIETRPKYIRNRFYQSYLVLNYSRMLHDLHKGRISSKTEGIKWAKDNLDPKWIPLIDFCWEERQDTSISIKQPMKTEIFEKSLDFVKYAVKQARKFVINKGD